LTPLFCAAVSQTPQHVEIGKLLLESGAQVNSADHYYTPLHIATAQETEYCEDFMKILIDAGADTEAGFSSHCDLTCLAYCCCDVPDCEATVVKPIFLAFQSKKFLGKIQILAAGGADVNARDLEANTPLHVLAKETMSHGIKAEEKRWKTISAVEYLKDYAGARKGYLRGMKRHLKAIDVLVAAGADKKTTERGIPDSLRIC